MSFDKIKKTVETYYTNKIQRLGITPQGVDWNSEESQFLRFAQLCKVVDFSTPYTINDYGSGYGALVDYLDERGTVFRYFGFDLSEEMVQASQARLAAREDCTFFSDPARLNPEDYTIASGIFNVRLDTDDASWKEYILSLLNDLNKVSKRGFSFNALTSYSDADRTRPDLFYSNPNELFDYCKQHFSRHVALLHDYPLYEFTILVRKDV